MQFWKFQNTTENRMILHGEYLAKLQAIFTFFSKRSLINQYFSITYVYFKSTNYR